ncbi:hypothetical protein [Priestia megaterium]|uniref:hypothetical protein n=1 Tax=Priestia megaterium TaxID=1404 RepID=UPI0023DBA241|nr:hypothetical protein [Priestia megaterium]MDF2010235.1 hypothetical protein [Priestia megaterium]
MSKQQVKAKKIVDSALGTFSKAVTEIEKANDLLSQEIEKDLAAMQEITTKIENLKSELDELQADKIGKDAEIIRNKELIYKLEKFIK